MSGQNLEINWEGETNEYLLDTDNPENGGLVDFVESKFSSHIIVATSGTTAKKKWVALSKFAILQSAISVNSHLQVTNKDSWFLTLPVQHIGGFSIVARSYLGKNKIVSYVGKWNPEEFTEQLSASETTLSAIVPTQLHDLVAKNLKAPNSLRAILVGGGGVNETLYLKARKLGWPVLLTYGMSECSSQVATAPLSSLQKMEYPEAEVLKHNQVSVSKDGRLSIISNSLYSAYVEKVQDFYHLDSRDNQPFLTQDLAETYVSPSSNKLCLKIKGRISDIKKVRGVLINESIINNSFRNFSEEFLGEVILLPDSREENIVTFISESKSYKAIHETIINFNKQISFAEQIRVIYFIQKIPRTELGKISRLELLNDLAL